ncbi:hypothetical protein [Chengkuizengella axinellae]|uniref:Uncharacterized protein n=1 Tax=Chengkuizengella axinellae TaxID=3064388 RepID=A0ABT9J0U6_9BACL|nr:hypothetical protein [Chengkuizengella sp. 2205SS18-9]MDP5275195.1 hypothetical protein [Chengkuizengella sp. 2205SS18-9]
MMGLRVTGIILLLLSIAIIPLLIYGVGVPWHAIKVFAADVALLTILLVILLAMNGLLFVFMSFRQNNMKIPIGKP